MNSKSTFTIYFAIIGLLILGFVLGMTFGKGLKAGDYWNKFVQENVGSTDLEYRDWLI